jgi:hypothetical protein
MSLRPSHFSQGYREARDRFLRAAEARGARLQGRPIAARGARGEELSVDTAYLGPDQPQRLLAISSGIHGVEGFAGSAIQHQLLAEQWDGLDLPGDTGLLLVHAVNPYGFAELRRVNENNVDLNRNFLGHPDEHAANPSSKPSTPRPWTRKRIGAAARCCSPGRASTASPPCRRP